MDAPEVDGAIIASGPLHMLLNVFYFKQLITLTTVAACAPPPQDEDVEEMLSVKSDKRPVCRPLFSSWKDRISEALGILTVMEKLTN